ncbi:terminase large subunit [Acinetobacter radioresistens]|uniref:terminase large subunit n=1 Tax=Acinetobacter radioresistens TaxID=40216 RepID=UPI002005F386|nr:terminase TerL endonuclease subunit [Acinetobacter radioresistens]MCK4111565.1 terminase large subunit [Acinetobacter radioresistens]
MTRGERVIAFIERYCKAPEGAHVGQPIILEDFQKKFILDVYDNPHGTHTAILSIARKNGKTALIAGILLAHLIGPEAQQNSQIVSGALSRDQAAIVFKLAVKMINLNEALQDLVHIIPSTKTLVGLAKNVEFRALSAEGKTTHGLSPILAILDETGQVKGPQDEFVDAVVTAQGAHEAPLLMVISTQAATDADLLSIWIDDALKGEDPKTVCHLYTTPMESDILDKESWKLSNPALGKFRSEPDMQKLAEKASRMPSAENTFRNLNLNQRVSTVSPFVAKQTWDSCLGELPPIYECDEVWAGLDLSARTDLTACVFVGRKGDKFYAYPVVWTPEIGLIDRAKRDRVPYDLWVKQGYMFTTPGATVDYEYVAKHIGEVASDVKILHAIAFDRWRIDVFKKECDKLGLELPLVPFGQGFKDMSPALDTVEAQLLNARIIHNNNPALNMAAANAVVVKDPAGGRKLDKSKATNRIDPMVALTMACGVSNFEETKQATYNVYFI